MAPISTPPNPIKSDFGDFVGSDDECEVETDAEPLARYEEGLYCPLAIGQVLNSQYRIEHKLGWGGFSTVWLAHDIQENTAVALKVAVSGPRGEYEREIHNTIIQMARDTSRLVLYQAAFDLVGRENNYHLVLVIPLRGPSLDVACFGLPSAARVPAAKSLLLALQSLHEAGIVHGDLNSGAVLWDIEPIHHWTTAEKYQHLGRPRKVLFTKAEGGPGELVESLQFPLEMIRHSVYLGDFGHAIHSGTPVGSTLQFPLMFCAPERYHGMKPSFASDMWSFTCLLAKLYLGIEAFRGEGLTLVSRLVGTLGPLPPSWKGCYAGGDSAHDWWYDQSGQMPRPRISGEYETLEHRIDRLRPDICQEERAYVLSLMRKGFCYIPEHRITAAQMLQDPSFNSLMSYYRC